jgi:hypothetical protein
MRPAIFCAILMMSGCVSTPIEGIATPAKMEGYKVGSAHDTGRGKGTIVEFVPVTESINNWHHLATIQFMEGAHLSPDAAMQVLENTMKTRCPNHTEWRVISEGPHDVIYQWQIRSCPGQENQVEIARIMQGNDGLHRIAYTEKGDAMNPTNREVWMEVLKSAYVTKGDTNHPIQLTNNSQSDNSAPTISQ